MDEAPPSMRDRWRLQPTFDTAQEYGGEYPDEFGGVHWARDPRRVVFLATAHLDQHRRALLDRITQPGRVEVRRCRHTDRQIHTWIDEVYRRAHDQHQELHITGFGPSLGDDGFTVQVMIWPWSDDAAERVRNELASIPIEVGSQPPVVAVRA